MKSKGNRVYFKASFVKLVYAIPVQLIAYREANYSRSSAAKAEFINVSRTVMPNKFTGIEYVCTSPKLASGVVFGASVASWNMTVSGPPFWGILVSSAMRIRASPKCPVGKTAKSTCVSSSKRYLASQVDALGGRKSA